MTGRTMLWAELMPIKARLTSRLGVTREWALEAVTMVPSEYPGLTYQPLISVRSSRLPLFTRGTRYSAINSKATLATQLSFTCVNGRWAYLHHSTSFHISGWSVSGSPPISRKMVTAPLSCDIAASDSPLA